MLRNLRRLLFSLAAVVAAWWLYALAVVPWVDPQIRRSTVAESSATETSARHELTQTSFRDQLVKIFPPGSWELGEPKVLETDQGVFLFLEYHELPDQKFEIKPCTLVVFSKPKSANGAATTAEKAGRVVVMQAPEGAQLQFDATSDLARFRFGKLEGGRLPGEISIWSREPAGGQPLNLKTSNIQIEEGRIWTPHPVEFQFGASHGRGRDLEIRLQRTVAAGEEGASGAAMGSAAMGNVQSVELVHLDQLHLEGLVRPDDSPTGKSAESPTTVERPADGEAPRDDASPNGAPSASAAPRSTPGTSSGARASRRGAVAPSFADSPLDIRCRGPVRLNVVDLVATLEEEVTVTRSGQDAVADRLSCDVLTVVLKAPTPATDDAPRPKQAKFEVERLIAAGRLVELNAPSQRASARGQRLEIDVPARRLRLDGEQGCLLAHESVEISAVNLEYELATNSGEIGRAWAQGPGRLKGQFGSTQSSATCEATWGKELQLRPHEGLQVVSLTGGATVAYGDNGRFAAESLHLWLRPLADAPAGRPNLLPDRLLAQGDVSVTAPQLTARTQRVEAWFRDANDSELAAAGAARQPGRLASSGGGESPAAGGLPFGARPSSGNQFAVNGDLVRVALLRLPGGSIGLETLEVTGGVVIREGGATSGGEQPLEIRGDRLRLEHASAGGGMLRVIGQPATVAARGMSLLGAEVQLDQSTNRIRIPGAGEMTLPPFDLKTKPREGVVYENPAALNTPASASVGRPTKITWKNGLEFDGQTAKFDREVQVRAAQRLATGEWLELVLIGGELDVRLTGRVLFAEGPRDPAPPSVDSLRFDGGVYLDGRTRQGDLVTSHERMQLRNLTLHQATGKLVGEGPGWLSGARLDDGSLAAAPGAPGAPPRDVPPGAPRILFLHVAFMQGIEGHLADRQIEFIDRVRAIFSPVPNWETELDPQRPDEWPVDAVELRCDRLSVAQQGGASPDTSAAELNALGNAKVESRKFGAQAARISYSQAKDLLVLAGDGRSGAEFWKKPRTQAKPDASANTIMYSLRDSRVSVTGVKYVDLNSLGP